MAKYVLLVATSASCFRNWKERGLSDFLLSGGEGQKQIQWGGYIWEREKSKIWEGFQLGKDDILFWAFWIHLRLQMISKGSCEDWGWDSCKSKEEIWWKWGKRRQKELCWQTRHLMKWKNRPILQSDDIKEWKVEIWGGKKINYLNCHWQWINLKKSVSRSALYNKDYDGCNSKYFWPSLFKLWHFCKTLVSIIHMFNSSRV